MYASNQTRTANDQSGLETLNRAALSQPSLSDTSSSHEQDSHGSESNQDEIGGGKGGPDSKASHSPRWAISKKAKLILEQIFQMERFPSAEMRRRLAEDFEVEPRQVQFWFQNRRQRDSRALKAAQMYDGGADGKQSGTSTSNADAILEQLRMMNDARRSLNNTKPKAPNTTTQMLNAPVYVPGQPTPPVYMPGTMMTGSPIVKIPQMTGQMTAQMTPQMTNQIYGSPMPAMTQQPTLQHLSPQMQMASQQPQIVGPPQMQQQQSPPHLMSTQLPQQQQMVANQQQQMIAPQQQMPQQLLHQQHLAHMMQMQMPAQMQRMPPLQHMQHMPQHPQQRMNTTHMSHMMGMPQQAQSAAYCSSQHLGPDGRSMPPTATFYDPSMRLSSDNDDMAAATMMGLCRSHQITCDSDDRIRSK